MAEPADEDLAKVTAERDHLRVMVAELQEMLKASQGYARQAQDVALNLGREIQQRREESKRYAEGLREMAKHREGQCDHATARECRDDLVRLAAALLQGPN